MKVGDLVEFLSAEGKWKPAVLVEKPSFYQHSTGSREPKKFVRLQTGPTVFIIRDRAKVRLREGVTCEKQGNTSSTL